MAHGGTLTINPQTGLPEAGFLDSLLPTLLGGAATFFSGGAITPFMAALGVGGLTALTSKDLGKGLMAGLGAYGGAGIAGGLMNFGEAAIGAEAAKAAMPSGIAPVGAGAGITETASKTAQTGASNFDKLSRGVTEGFKNPMGAFSSIGGGSKLQGAAMLGAPLLSALSSQDQTSVPTAEQIKFDPSYANINIRRSQRPYQPDTGSSGERRYFGNTYVTQYADGGAVANDGIEHFAYGGGTIDPTYDYSGYGPRSNSSGMRPIAYAEAAKPDFVGADGKTYRYDPIKKSWYVIKEAETKTNPGVETLMVGSDRGGNDGGGGENQPNTKPDWGTTFQIGKAITSMGLPTIGGYLERAATNGILGQSNAAAKEADALPSTTTGLPQGYDTAASRASRGTLGTDASNTAQQGFRAGELNAQNAKNIADQTQRDAVTSASSPTATGGKANSPSGIASLGIGLAPAVEAQAEKNQIDAQAEQDPAIQSQANREAQSVENARDVSQKAMASDIAALVSELSDNPNDNPGRAPSLGTGTTAGWGGSDIGGSDLGGGGYDGGGDPGGPSGAQAKGGMVGRYAQGGLGSLGGYSDGGRLLRGPGNGVSDDIPATIGAARQPARLADGEFVLPARIVSELGNGSTEAGARALYKMMARIQANRRKTTGKNSVAVDSKAHKYLPA